MNLRKVHFTILLFFSLLTTICLQAQESNTNLTTRVLEKNTDGKDIETNFRSFRATIGGGYAYRLGTMDKVGNAKLNDFMSKLRHGYNLDLGAEYYFEENWGLGLNAVYIRESNSEKELFIPKRGTVKQYEEYNQFIYIGPSFAGRLNYDKFGLYGNVGLGPLFHKNMAKISNSMVANLNHVAFGSYISVAGEYKVNQTMGLGLKLSLLSGFVSTKDYGLTDDRLNVSNFMLTGFLSFRTSK